MVGDDQASSETISVPKGGGALHGIGETFSPDLFTGTGNFTVPIALPNGRNGFQPKLSLGYSTGNGNGPFGMGWALSMPGITRKTSHGWPLFDASDTFLLSGAEDLIAVSAAPDGSTPNSRQTFYRPRTEGLFAKIEHVQDQANHDDYWKVSTKDGLVSYYSAPGTAGNADPPGIIAHPDHRKKVFSWRLTRTTDPFGNLIDYEYVRDRNTDGPHHWDQLYLKRIRYVDFENAGATQYLVSVEFFYDYECTTNPPLAALIPSIRARPDPFSEYRATFEIRTRYRCTLILVSTHPAGSAPIPVRAYRLVYLDERTDIQDLTELLPANGASMLSRIEVTGFDDTGNASKELPPLDFKYSAFEPAMRRFVPVPGSGRDVPSLAWPNLDIVDLHGFGLPDFLEMSGSVRYWRNLGQGKFSPPRPMRDAPLGLNLNDVGVELIDANGDGRADLLVQRPDLSACFSLEFGPKWKQRPSLPRQVPSFRFGDPEVKLLDLDGDGVTDALRSGVKFECYFNDRRQGWKSVRTVARKCLDEFPDVNFSDPRVRFSSMTGSGLQDIVLCHSGNVEYWPNLGRGDWGKRIQMASSPSLPWGYDPRRVLLGDVDGDGCADFIYVDSDKVTIWFNRSGNGWSAPVVIPGTPQVSDFDSLRIVDLYGNGTAGLLFSASTDRGGRPAMYFLDLTGGIKPYLLTEMNNNLGAITRVQYVPSTNYYRDDEKTSAMRWRTPLPFPVQVVARVEVIDQISLGKLTTEFRYHNGYWDGAEREFRGFGMVEKFSSEGFDEFNARGLHGASIEFNAVSREYFSQPTLERTWFHQGPVGEEFGDWHEQDYSNEYWRGDSPKLGHKSGIDQFLRTNTTAAYPYGRRDRRDALRALRGNILRSELYALDGSDLQDRPYTVTEHAYALREESPAAAGEPERRRIFFPHLVAQRTTQWERGNDPMTQFAYDGDYDAFGQSCRQISIACPRGWKTLGDKPAQPYLATLSVSTYAQPPANGPYIHDRVARTRTYEIQSSATKSIADINSTTTASTYLRLIAESLNFYDGDSAAANHGAFTGLGFGQVGKYGALVRTESLALTNDILNSAYGANIPPYLNPNTPFAASAEYPQAFVNSMPALAGYVFKSGGAGSDYSRGYFIIATRKRYDFHNAAGTGSGLVLAQRDPLGNDTEIEYDTTYQLLPITVTDPQGMTVRAEYNYRLLQPKRVTDPNNNVTDVEFTPAGLVKKIWVRGKIASNVGDMANEGDRAEPGTTFEYGLRAFYDSILVDPIAPKPIYARAVKRLYHDSDSGVDPLRKDETIETREYSDGFGRLLQTRTQGEALRFGDEHFGGGDTVLPADQSSGPVNRIAGTQNSSSTTPNVTVSGWQRYDNKGQVVEKFEPYFDKGWDYDPPAAAKYGQKVVMHYDPRGQLIRTVNPDASEQRVIYGIPLDLADPPLSPLDTTKYRPTPWEAYTYDANDNAGRTHAATSAGYSSHWNSPASIEIDALGRTVKAVARTRAGINIEEHSTRSAYDIQGNVIEIRDALGRLAFAYCYDLAKHPLRTESIDAGQRTVALNAVGFPIENRDAKGAITLRAYDKLHRPTKVWARNSSTAANLSLRESLSYGDGQIATLNDTQKLSLNLFGKLYEHKDEAGIITLAAPDESGQLAAYDFKGNLLQKRRQVIADSAITAQIDAQAGPNKSFVVDWDNPPALEGDYQTSVAYDALNRVKWMRYPEDVSGNRKKLIPAYNRAGALENVALDADTYVERIAYNAKGQRVLIAYGNGLTTRYAYDAQTFRLARMRTERYTKPLATSYKFSGGLLQDFAYQYDLAGNILKITDVTPGCGVTNSLSGRDLLERTFTYDPLYRLTSATGREDNQISNPRAWTDDPRQGFNSGNHGTPNQDNAPDLTALYLESYEYDPAGNMQQLKHQSNGVAWSRYFGMAGSKPSEWRTKVTQYLSGNTVNWAPGGNRLTNFGNADDAAASHAFDANGNMVLEFTNRNFGWDHADRMIRFSDQPVGSNPTKEACYLYGADGIRVKKWVRDNQNVEAESTVYVDDVFEFHRWNETGSAAQKQNNYVHVMDDKTRIALVRNGDKHLSDVGPNEQYQLSDHLGSCSLVVSSAGTWINREEYFPYGETSFGCFGKKRYRLTGKERDDETGFYYMAARYYLGHCCRWCSCDPIRSGDALNLFLFVENNPLRFSDPSGMQAHEPSVQETPGGSNSPSVTNPEGTKPTELPTNLVYSSSEAAKAKRSLDTKLFSEGVEISPKSGTYWRRIVTELTGTAPGDAESQGPSKGAFALQFYYIKGGWEGFPGIPAKGDAESASWDKREGKTDINDALVIFDSRGKFLEAFQLAVPNYYPKTSQMVTSDWNGAPIFSYLHEGPFELHGQWFNEYQGLSVLDSGKARQMAGVKGSYWIDIHKRVGTAGCIEINNAAFTDQRNIDRFFQELIREFGEQQTMHAPFTDKSGNTKSIDVTRKFIGRMFVTDVVQSKN